MTVTVKDTPLLTELLAVLKAHDVYMKERGHSGPEDQRLHPEAAANWRRVRDVLKKAEGR